MEGSALVKVESNTDNEVYLESGKTVTVTGALTHEPAAKIRLAQRRGRCRVPHRLGR